MGKIGLQGVKVFAHIGVTEEERKIGRNFIIDIEVNFDVKASGKSDSINDTFDYGVLLSVVHSQMNKTFHLMEGVARSIIAEVLKEHPNLTYIKIHIRKLCPFLEREIGSSFIEMEYPTDF